MDNALITIVMPVYNRADVVGRTLDSIAAQTLRPLRLVVVDNNSSDHSLDVVSKWADTHRSDDLGITVLSENKPGAAAARNRGLSVVQTPYVMFFDSDDIMLPGHVADVVQTLRSNPDALIVGRDILFRLLTGHTKRLVYGADAETVIFHGGLSTQRYAVQTDLCRRCGGWDERLTGWDDLDLGLRLYLAAGGRMARIPGSPGVIAFQTAESLTGLSFSARRGEWERTLDAMASTAAGHSQLERYIELRRVVLAAHYCREGYKKEAQDLLTKVLSHEPSVLRRCFYRFAYAYTVRGGRGISRLAPLIL